MKRFATIVFLSGLLLMRAFAADKIDINNAAPEELRRLPVPESVIEQLEEFLLYHGEFSSIYQIREIPGISYAHFLQLRDAVSVFPKREYDETAAKIEDRYYRLESMMNDE
ncbi:MAG: helix-hairpin-helix domain-containing protein, partial [Candidatus Marinimicrobia bacterium]|nr:helix-hairpin-helix domain-containing protein [Candidatus Neomarinimicrobiota bacterium]